MRFVTFRSSRGARPGLILDAETFLDISDALDQAIKAGSIEPMALPGTIVDLIEMGQPALDACRNLLEGAKAGSYDSLKVAAGEVELLAPIPQPRKNVFCVGSNYRAHVTESSKAQAKEDKAPEYPVFFTKPPTAVIGPGAAIGIDSSVSEKFDYEVELALVFGARGRNIRAANAKDHLFGVTIVNDVTARDLQRRHGQFLKGKGQDRSCPMGPEIVTLDEIGDIEDLRISLQVNGQTRQDGNTGSMIFSVAALVASLSEGLTLEPGDILATGTPSGVGYAMDPPNYLQAGDVISCDIEGIGRLENRVEENSAAVDLA